MGTLCKIDGCEKGARGQGMCPMHYARLRRLGDPLAGGKFYGEPKKFIESLFENPQPVDECVNWPYAKNKTGYAQIGIKGKAKTVSRMVCIRVNGEPEEGLVARHTCGKGHEACVNPNHLIWGTYSENAMDMYEHETIPLGENRKSSVLKEEQVLEIYARSHSGEVLANIAREFGVGASTIGSIKCGNTWNWLTKHKEKEGGD